MSPTLFDIPLDDFPITLEQRHISRGGHPGADQSNGQVEKFVRIIYLGVIIEDKEDAQELLEGVAGLRRLFDHARDLRIRVAPVVYHADDQAFLGAVPAIAIRQQAGALEFGPAKVGFLVGVGSVVEVAGFNGVAKFALCLAGAVLGSLFHDCAQFLGRN